MVGVTRFELVTSAMSRQRSNQLSYTPTMHLHAKFGSYNLRPGAMQDPFSETVTIDSSNWPQRKTAHGPRPQLTNSNERVWKEVATDLPRLSLPLMRSRQNPLYR